MQDDLITFLADEWDKLMAAGSATDTDSTLIFGNIVQAYTEPHRHYHTLAHLASLLDQMDHLNLDHPASVKLAIFYHDLIYATDPATLKAIKDGTRSSNETQSALVATEDMKVLGFSQDTIDRTVEMIRLTESHQLQSGTNSDAAFFLDMDMSILGAQPEAYGRYVAQIYSEFSHIDRQVFMQARLGFIDATLQSPNIFHTDLYRWKYDRQARENLKRERDVIVAGDDLRMLKKISLAAAPAPR